MSFTYTTFYEDIWTGKLSAEKLVYWINRGCDINGKDQNGITSLCYAARGGHIAILKFLLAKGANPNQCSDHNRTALWYATRLTKGTGAYPIVLSLIKAGADVNAAAHDEIGNPPLLNAICSGDIDVIKLLLAHGACKTTKNKHGCDAADLAEKTGDIEIIKLFKDYVPVDPGVDRSLVESTLEYLINHATWEETGLATFYPGEPRKAFADAAERGAKLAEYIMSLEANPQKEVASQAGLLALYDLVILLGKAKKKTKRNTHEFNR